MWMQSSTQRKTILSFRLIKINDVDTPRLSGSNAIDTIIRVHAETDLNAALSAL